MGWFWTPSSSAPPAPGDEPVEDPSRPRGAAGLPHQAQEQRMPSQPQSNIALTNEQRGRIFGRSGLTPAASPSSDDLIAAPSSSSTDAEVEAFFHSLAAPAPPASTPNATSASPSAATPQLVPDRVRPDGSIDISAEALLPRSMSCRQAFDQAFYCQSLGGKFNDVYRYGEVKSCSEQWGAFWFCMRIRTFSDAQRQDLIRGYYRERDAKRRAENGGSSEDIWRARDTALPKAFWRDPDADSEVIE